MMEINEQLADVEGLRQQLREVQAERDKLLDSFTALQQVVEENREKNILAKLQFTDYTIGLSAELEELKSRDRDTDNASRIATDALRAEMTKGYETGKLLVAEITKSHAAETLVLKLQAEVANIQRLQNELDAVRQSRAFKIGHAITSPMRMLRRIFL